jgi:glyoxylase-like metal-dependent hydrolase (beta-lactamase superfamily II)
MTENVNRVRAMSITESSSEAVKEIDPGVWAIRVPMPQHPLRASFCYVYVADGHATVIDPGWPTSESWDQLESALRSIGVEPEGVTSILLTHAHRDHSGLAGRLAAVSGAPVWLHDADRVLLPRPDEEHKVRVLEWMEMVGARTLDDGSIPVGTELPRFPPPVAIDRWLEDGQVIRVPGGELVVHWTPGHTPGHVCFEDTARGLLFSGDHLLPRITPNISSMVGHRTSALGDYLHSLAKVAALTSDRVMPGHEYAFRSPASRAAELVAHHRERLQEIKLIMACNRPWSTFEVARELTWSRPWEQIIGLQQRAALGEVLSHLYHLETSGDIRADRSGARVTWMSSEAPSLNGVRVSAGMDG